MASTTTWQPPEPDQRGFTIERHILEGQRAVKGATGELTALLQQITLCSKIIGSRVNMAGLADHLGLTGETNVQGEEVQKLDELANATLIRNLSRGGKVCALGSEEESEPVLPPAGYPTGKYVVLFDPLDGSSNIDVNVSIGTIFSIHERVSGGSTGGTVAGPAAGGREAGGGRLRHLRLVDHARLHDRPGRTRLHARPLGGRLLPVARQHPHARSAARSTR